MSDTIVLIRAGGMLEDTVTLETLYLYVDFDCRNDYNLKTSHNSPPDSWPVCFMVWGGLSDILGAKPS